MRPLPWRGPIGSGADGLPWVAHDGQEALTVPPGNAFLLAEAIARLLADHELAACLGAAGRRRAATGFGLAAFEAETTRVYDEVLAIRGAVTCSSQPPKYALGRIRSR